MLSPHWRQWCAVKDRVRRVQLWCCCPETQHLAPAYSLLQLQLPPPMGAGLYDGIIFLLLKLLAQVPAYLSPFAWSLPKGVGAKRPECGSVMEAEANRGTGQLWLSCATL